MNDKIKNKDEKLNKEYTHPEFLREFFPNINPAELDSPEDIVSEEQVFNLQDKVVKPLSKNKD